MGYFLYFIAFLGFLFFSLLLHKNEMESLKIHNFLVKNKLEKNLTIPADYPTSSHYNVEEIEQAMIGICQSLQAHILICRSCYQAGNTYCPYPTNNFCESVKNLNEEDPSVVWSFLPNNNGYVKDLQNLQGKNPNDLETKEDLALVGIYRLNKTITYSILDPNLKYTKPTDSNTTSPCAVSDFIHK